MIDLIIKAEDDGLETETELGAYIWAIYSSGLWASTGTMCRNVEAYAEEWGDDWQAEAEACYKEYMAGVAA